MSGNWDDDDYDPSAQMADKIASLGLDDVIRQKEKEAQQKGDKVTPTTATIGTNGGRTERQKEEGGTEMSERDKREAQLRADGAAAMDLFGLSVERKEPTFDDLRTKDDFQAFADKLGEQFEARHDDPNYLLFVSALVDHMTKPMSKLQLQIVLAKIQTHLDVHLKREEEEQKRLQEKTSKKETKKAKKKELEEDVIEDEYDDYDEQLHRY